MTHVNYNMIDRTVKANKLYRFTSELDELDKNEDNDKERIKTLQTIIDTLNAQKNNKQISDEKMQAHFEILKNSQYQKKWQFLTLTQKLNRLQDFIDRNDITDEIYIAKLKYGVNENMLRGKEIKYDIVKCCIESITTNTALDTVCNIDATDDDSKKKDTSVSKNIKCSNKSDSCDISTTDTPITTLKSKPKPKPKTNNQSTSNTSMKQIKDVDDAKTKNLSRVDDNKQQTKTLKKDSENKVVKRIIKSK